MPLHDTRKTTLAAALLSLAIGAAPVIALYAQEPAGPALEPPLPAAPAAAPATGPEAAPVDEAGVDAEGVETLTRGPVHEAFAAPAAADPTPTDVVKAKPPEPIDEVAPDFKPEGAIWIPGYWEWDVATEEFIWISGLWRLPPPGMRWVPPYWTEVDGGWQRVPGFWISSDVTELEYREPPPESLDVGPTTPAPGENYFYVPGTWSYYDTGYRWRTGYWSPYRDDWCWVPARWYWTPAGCVYSGGYWDRRPSVRAYMFAPVAFRSNVYLRPGWRYRPWCVLDTSRLFVHLWIGPRYNNYYFGNYYGGFNRWGFTPWCDWNYGFRRCYDPLWSWSHVHYRRHGIDYIGRCRGWHRHFARNERDRPGRNWAEQRRLIADGRGGERGRGQNVLARVLREVAERDDAPLRLARTSDKDRERIRAVSDEIRQLHSERSKLERQARLARTEGDAPATESDVEAGRRGGAGREGQGANGRGGERRTAKVKLPKASAEFRRTARSSADRGDGDGPDRGTAGTRDTADAGSGAASGAKDKGKQNSVQDRIRAARDAAERDSGPAGERDAGRTAERDGGQRGSGNKTASDASRGVQDRIRAAREAAAGASNASASKGSASKSSASKGSGRPTARGSSSKGSQPRVERPATPRIEAPRSERRSETPRLEAPRAERRLEAPRIETRRPQSAPRIERTQPPRIQSSRPGGGSSRGGSSRGSASRSSSFSRPSAARGGGSSARASISRGGGSSRPSMSRSSGGSRSSASRGGGGGSRNSRSSRGRN